MAQRLKLILGKFPVVEVTRIIGNFRATISINGFKLTIHNLPPSADIRNGDLLTLYTEVLSNAQSEPTPIQ